MDSKKVLYFLGVLNNETTGRSEELAQLYNRALDENDDVIRLRTLLKDCNFYGELGNAMFKNGTEVLEKLYSDPSKSLEMLSELRQAHETINRSLLICEELMCSPFPFSETITVLKKKDTGAYMAALRTIAAVCVYMTALYDGLDRIGDLSWNDGVGLQEMLYAVNTKFIPRLLSTQRPYYFWMIHKRRMGGKALFDCDCFYLRYENPKSVEEMCAHLHKEPIGTHAFLNIDAYQTDAGDVPYCWGIGNLISARPDEALDFLKNDAADRARPPKADELKMKMPSPLECLKKLSDGAMFCVTPDELTLAMNRWYVGHEIEMHRSAHSCLFCGRQTQGNRLVCPSHFTSEL